MDAQELIEHEVMRPTAYEMTPVNELFVAKDGNNCVHECVYANVYRGVLIVGRMEAFRLAVHPIRWLYTEAFWLREGGVDKMAMYGGVLTYLR